MGLSESSSEVHIALDRTAAFNAVANTADATGGILQESEAMGTPTVRTRYGLQSVKLRTSVVPDTHGSRVMIGAFGDDVWGGGARKGTDKRLRALEDDLG
jgi:hypothetical protein